MHFAGTASGGFSCATASFAALGLIDKSLFSIELLFTGCKDVTIYVSDLAAAVKQPLPAVSRALRQLEQDGLIERITDPNDRRKTLVRPTEKGLDASRQVETAISRYFERVIRRIPEEQREQLFSLTGVLLEAVEAENAEQQAKLKGENENG